MATLRALPLAVLAALALTSSAQASLLIGHQQTAVTEQSAGDGLIGPGDAISLTETLISSEAASLTGITGRLTSTTPGVTITRGGSALPDVAPGDTTANTTPYTATIDPSVPCGQNLEFNVALGTDQGTQDIPFTVGTGAAGPLLHSDAVDVPRTLLTNTTISSTLQIDQPGLVKNIHVDLGRITHAGDGNLKIWIEAPDHTSVTLIDQRGGTTSDFVDTHFALTGANPVIGSGPFTGTYAAEGGLEHLVGHTLQGTWTLHIADFGDGGPGTLFRAGAARAAASLGDTADGALTAWGLDLAAATCGGDPIPNIVATPNPVLPGGTANFDASASVDPNGSIVDYAWDLDGDGTFETDTGTTPTASHVYPVKGSVTVGLRVTDDQGHQVTTTLPLAVTRAPTAAFVFLPAEPVSGDTITLDGSRSSDPDGTVVDYAWDLDGNGTFETDTAGVPTATVAFATAGLHTVRLRVTDDTGATAVRSIDILVDNHAPIARLMTPTDVVAGVPLTLDASASSDPDGSIADYAWQIDGAGSFVSSATEPEHAVTFATPGPHSVSVRVTDDAGATDTATVTFVVAAAPRTTPPGTTTGGGGGTSGGGAGKASPTARFTAGLRGAAIQALRLARTHGVTLTCRAAAPARCALTAYLDGRSAKRLGLAARVRKRQKVVGRAVVMAAPRADGRIVLALSAPLRRALRHARSVRLVVRGMAIDAAGHRIALKRVVLLRR